MSPDKSLLKPLRRLTTRQQGETLLVVVGATHVECGVLRGRALHWRTDGALAHPIADAAPATALPPVSPLLAALHALQAVPVLPAGSCVRVLVADCWLTVAGVTWSAAMGSRDGADQHARTQLKAAGFDSFAGDTLRLDDAPFGVPRLAVLYPATLLAALEQLAVHVQARLASVLPLSVAAWQQGDGAALVVVDAGLVLVASGASAERPNSVSVRWQADVAGNQTPAQAAAVAWQRACLRAPHLAALARVDLLEMQPLPADVADAAMPLVRIGLAPIGAADQLSPGLQLAAQPGVRHSALDAVLAKPGLSPWRAVLLLAGMALAAASLWHAADAGRTGRATLARLSAAQPVRQPVLPAAELGRDDAARVAAVNAAIRELNLPFAALLRALEPPADLRVALLSVETSGSAAKAGKAGLKIVAEAPSSADMARYVAFVAERPPLTGAYLVAHEIDVTVPEHPYRFTVEAQWHD